ncbi:MAG: extracellular solute-binding protein [Rubellimicrobium sp.]|nr:extracellular solute-binding protein [Rubellimicrobium sp.]
MHHITKTAASVIAALMLAAGAAQAADPDLTVFDWAGYEDPGFFADYVEKYGDAPTFAFFGDEEEAFQKLRSGFRADVVRPCSQSMSRWMDAGLLAPFDTGRIPLWDDLDPAFRDMPAFQRDGEHYFVPMDWGYTMLTYNTDYLDASDVQSLQAFADPAHAGRVSIGDNVDDAYALAFLATGVTDWTTATDEQFEAASAFLRRVHQNVRAYWADGSSLAQLMQSGEVYLAWAWNETYWTMTAEGYPIAINKDTDEGVSSWTCGFARLADGAGSEDKVYDFINAWLQPETAEYLVTEWGYGHPNAAAMAALPQDELAAVGLDSTEAIRENTLWQSPPPAALRERMIAEFELIKAGF